MRLDQRRLKLVLGGGLCALIVFLTGAGIDRGGLYSAMVIAAETDDAAEKDGAKEAGAPPVLTALRRGRGKAQLCTRCHGRLGMARAAEARNWPGTVEDFVKFNLSQFRSGRRVQAVMNAVAGPLSDVDIEDVAIWYQSMTPETKKPILE
ncbi:MAG: hypothetical protein DHS20C08_06800 [Rhodomicrobium sp.]|nr:MAG: hypothetical protein DHS20C08_06800 [Rhodomicrobium sp.]